MAGEHGLAVLDLLGEFAGRGDDQPVAGGPLAFLGRTGVVLLVLSVVMSALLLVPINSRVATWSREGAPADWKRQVRR
ncbi:hypothetical protein [Streptoalloteichus hindustanus]|uniref:hypothetical protein n=1 Tax=Streptoalloteichus hindustanus TaxID=2017 RepID=UPI00093697E1|nr:hypothetical protein [Streptoalloteichus hindustanus]